MKTYSFLIAGISFFLIFSSCKKSNDTTTITISDPVVVTSATSNITNLTAISGGNVTDVSHGNVVAKGVCWSVNEFPTIDNTSNKTMDGTGAGSFTSTITNLLPNKSYYVRAYATNEEGTGYGDNVLFTTSAYSTFQFGGVTIFVHPADTTLSAWGAYGTFLGATSLPNGKSNTAMIVGHGGASAAKTCAGLTTGGFTDWYLPSQDELDAMFQAKNQIGGFSHTDYWSSTETSDINAMSQSFFDGVQSAIAKNQVRSCRCIRKD
jgi:hypothetical protein